MQDKNTRVSPAPTDQLYTDNAKKAEGMKRESKAEQQELRRAFRASEQSSGKYGLAAFCILLGFLSLAVLGLTVFLTSDYTGGYSLLSSELPVAILLVLGCYALICTIVFLFVRRAEFARFQKRRAEEASDSSAIRLFKESIDLPYVVTNDAGKIIVANRAFEEAVSGKYSAVGEDIREICASAIDDIIRTTDADKEIDQTLDRVYTAAVHAYPTAIRRSTTADVCLELLQEISRLAGTSDDDARQRQDPDSSLCRVQKIASNALIEAQKRSELWHLCLNTFESILSTRTPGSDEREKLSHIYDLSRKAYRLALDKENEIRKESALKDFSETLREIVLLAESDASAGQIASACRLRLEMLEGKNLLPHLRTLLLNIRQQLASIFPDPSSVTDGGKNDVYHALLDLAEDKLEAIRLFDGTPAEERAFCVSVLTAVRNAAKPTGAESAGRTMQAILGIADAALLAFTPERESEYISLVLHEILNAVSPKRELSQTEDDIYRLTEKALEASNVGGKEDEIHLLDSFRDAIRRVAEESRLGTERERSEAERIRATVESEVSAALSFIELRTGGDAVLSTLIKQTEETLSLRDLSKTDQKLLTLALEQMKALKKELLEAIPLSPHDTAVLANRFSKKLADILREFDKKGDYSRTSVAIDNERSAIAGVKKCYAAIEKASASVFALSARQLGTAFFERAAAAIKEQPERLSMVEKAKKALKVQQLPGEGNVLEALPEVTDRAFGDRLWNDSSILLLLHIGILRATATESSAPVYTDLVRAAETTFEKLTVRRILVENLVSIPLSVSEDSLSDEDLYRTLSKYFRESALHRNRILFTVCRILMTSVLNFLETAKYLSAEENSSVSETLSAFRTELLNTHALMPSNAEPNANPTEISTLCADMFKSCAAKLESLTAGSPLASAYHGAVRYLAEFFESLNLHLLRGEIYRIYRDAASDILSRLSRAEYTLKAMEQIRLIAESVLSAPADRAVTFSGLSVEDCCSSDLRTIAELSGTNVIGELHEEAGLHAQEASAAKDLWHFRKVTLSKIEKRLNAAEACSRFYDGSLLRAKAEVGTILRLAEENHLLPVSEKAKRSAPADASVLPPDKQALLQNALSAPLARLSALFSVETEALPPDAPVDARFVRLLHTANAVSEAAFDKFIAAFTPFCLLLRSIRSDALSVKRNKKKILRLRSALKEEDQVSCIPQTGAPLSRESVSELFFEYLNATLQTVQSHGDDDALIEDIREIAVSAMRRAENSPSPYLRLFASASLSKIVRFIREQFSAEAYTAVFSPLSKLISLCRKELENENRCPTPESILETSDLAFREADLICRISEIANEYSRLSKDISVSAELSDAERKQIFTTSVEVRKKIEAYCRDIPTGSSAALLCSDLCKIARELAVCEENLKAEKVTASAYREAYALLETVFAKTAAFRPLTDGQSRTFRTLLARLCRSVRELADASRDAGTRSYVLSALSSVRQYAETLRGEQAAVSAAESASAEIAKLPNGSDLPDAVCGIACAAFSKIASVSSHVDLRTRAELAQADLAERRTVYLTLVKMPAETLKKDYPDPTDEKIYDSAKALYERLETAAPRFRAELLTGILGDTLETMRTVTKPDAFSRIRSLCGVLEKLIEEFDAELRTLAIGSGEYFVSPSLRAKQKQLRIWFGRLFDIAKRASSEFRENPQKYKIAESVTVAVLRGVKEFDDVAASRTDGAMNRLSAVCRKIVEDARILLDSLSESERCLSEIHQTTGSLLSALNLPSAADASVSDERYTAVCESLLQRLRRGLREIEDKIERFEELPGSSADTFSISLCKNAARNALSALDRFASQPDAFSSDSLTATVASVLKKWAGRKGKDQKNSLVAVYDEKGNPSGQNNIIKKRPRSGFVPVRQNVEATYLEHGLSVTDASLSAGKCVVLGGRRYLAKSYPHRSGGRDYHLVTFTAAEETLTLKQTCEDENTVVALIVLDNLEELAQYVRIDYREAEQEVERALRNFAAEIHGIFHEYERDKYILFFSQKEMASLVNSKFSEILSALENIRLGDSSVPVTISMGISALGSTLTIKERNAAQALDLALKRGGAQIVIYRDKPDDRYEFFSGNRIKGLQKEDRISARVVSNYLCELIRKSGDVLIMGHSYPDFDSIGSCVGIAALARYLKKDVHIVVNRRAQNFIDCTPDLRALPEYRNAFIDGTTGMELKSTDTLLVLCDVSNTKIMEYVDIARTSFNTVIIDHHFKTTDSENLNPILTYVDPSASSASELVSEILEEALPKGELKKEEANVLLSGIMVDTKNFTRSVGARTFAAALYLRNMGANAEISNTYFYEQSGDYKAEVLFRKNLEFHKNHKEIAITCCLPDDIEENPEIAGCDLRVAASKAADKLLTVRGVRASFALYPYSGGGKFGVAISGRSDGSINVQEILELFGGGGHFDAAGASLEGFGVTSAVNALSALLDEYFAESDGEEEA